MMGEFTPPHPESARSRTIGRRSRDRDAARKRMIISAVFKAVLPAPTSLRLLGDVLGKQGRPKKGERKPVGNRIMYGSTNRAYILARLDRDGETDLAADVRSGMISPASTWPDRVSAQAAKTWTTRR
jgi:hypothetical protein